jgi:class 3 adenylate cyclase
MRSGSDIRRKARRFSFTGRRITIPWLKMIQPSGVVLSGHIGPDVKRTLTFIGESFKVAYSLNVMAGTGEIIMSKDVYQSVEQNVSVEPLAPREMAQRTEPWENFRLIKMIEKKDYSRGI